MRFVYPEFLYALAVLAIPVIIHLFNFRRYKKVYFSNISLLKEVREQTQNRSRLKHLLVLLARMLALTFLVFAFAQPFIPGSATDEARGDKIISVYIDNSFSMEAEGRNGRLLDYAREKAAEIASEYSATDQFQLVTNSFEGYQQRLVSRDEFLDMVDEVSLSPASRSVSDVLSRQLDILEQYPEAGKRIIWISDFQKTTTNIEAIEKTDLPKIICLPVQAEESDNVYIDSAWFESPVRQLGAQEQLKVRIVNNGNAAIENAPLSLLINGQQKSLGSFSCEAGTSCDSTLYFTNLEAGVQQAVVKINDAHVLFDDSYYFSFNVQDKVNVLSLTDDHKTDTLSPVKQLFRNDPYFKLKSVRSSQIDYSELPDNDLVILEELPEISSGLGSELTDFIHAGGSVLFFPAMKMAVNNVNNFLLANDAALFINRDTALVKTENIDFHDAFYSGIFGKDPVNIDLPQVNIHFKTESKILNDKQIILQLKNGDDFLYRVKSGKGYCYVCTVPLDDKAGNFSRHALFVPILLRIAEWSQNSGIAANVIGKNEVIDIRGMDLSPDLPVEIVNTEKEFSVIPEVNNNSGAVSLYVHGQIGEAGNYEIQYDKKIWQGVGFNYDRSESDLSCYSAAELQSAMEKSGIKDFKLFDKVNDDTSLSLEAIDDSAAYWKWCLYLALFFILIEILLLRFLKN